MYRPGRIFDSHIHLITARTHQARREWISQLPGELIVAYRENWERSLSSRNEEHPEEHPQEVAAVAARWAAEFERAGVERGVFFTSTEDHEEIARFVSLGKGRYIGYATFNPTASENARMLQELIDRREIRGVKLYPMARHFHVDDPACHPVFEVCHAARLPVIIHFGLSINATHDLRYGNPLDLAAPALRFPAVRWIIPHFGAGFFAEMLLVAAQYRNVFVDTSSSNSWIRYSASGWTLDQVFRRCYEALGAGKIIFGTDSSFFPRGYRTNLLEQQLEIFNRLGLSHAEIDDIFFGNIEQILRL